MIDISVEGVSQNSITGWVPGPGYTYPQPTLDSGSWQCGGCKVWYAPWVRQCYCQKYNNWYPHIPVATPPYTTCVGSLTTEENKDWVLVNG